MVILRVTCAKGLALQHDASHPETPRAFMNDEEEAAFRAYMRAWYQLNHGDDVRRDVADAGFEEGGAGDDDDDIYG